MNNVISEYQHGLMKGRSYLTSFLDALEDLTSFSGECLAYLFISENFLPYINTFGIV